MASSQYFDLNPIRAVPLHCVTTVNLGQLSGYYPNDRLVFAETCIGVGKEGILTEGILTTTFLNLTLNFGKPDRRK